MNNIIFKNIVKKNKVKKHHYFECLLAFLGGGMIGIIAQGLIDLYQYLGLEEDIAFTLSSLTLVISASILTILSIYKKLGQIFGGGLFIPITGFSNSMVSSALEGKSDGVIFGIGGRIFSLAGSVICYGVFFSIFVVLIRYLLSLFGVQI